MMCWASATEQDKQQNYNSGLHKSRLPLIQGNDGQYSTGHCYEEQKVLRKAGCSSRIAILKHKYGTHQHEENHQMLPWHAGKPKFSWMFRAAGNTKANKKEIKRHISSSKVRIEKCVGPVLNGVRICLGHRKSHTTEEQGLLSGLPHSQTQCQNQREQNIIHKKNKKDNNNKDR